MKNFSEMDTLTFLKTIILFMPPEKIKFDRQNLFKNVFFYYFPKVPVTFTLGQEYWDLFLYRFIWFIDTRLKKSIKKK